MRRPVQGALEAVEPGQRDSRRRAKGIDEEGSGAPGDHRDQRERRGELGHQFGHAGKWARVSRIPDDGGERPVEIEE